MSSQAPAIVTLHVLALKSSTTPREFISLLPESPIITAKVLHWILLPSAPSKLLNNEWDIVLVFPSSTLNPFPTTVQQHIVATHTTTFSVMIPDAATFQKFDLNNKTSFLNPSATENTLAPTNERLNPFVPPPEEEHAIQLSTENAAWLSSCTEAGAVTMLNFLSYLPDGGREKYMAYIGAFAEVLGPAYGGRPKIYGSVIGGDEKWEDIGIIHYPSIVHFADMLAGKKYHGVDSKFKVGALKDTGLLCLTEVGW